MSPRGVYERQDWMFPQQTESRSDTLTRQQYVNRFVAEYQRAWGAKVTWSNLLAAFRSAGREYDSQQRRAA